MQHGQCVRGERLALDADQHAAARRERFENEAVVGLEAGPANRGGDAGLAETFVGPLQGGDERAARNGGTRDR